jgi:hypothetical protein
MTWSRWQDFFNAVANIERVSRRSSDVGNQAQLPLLPID